MLCMSCSVQAKQSHFFAPRVLFLSLSWLPLHFLQRSAEIGFLPPHLKHTLKNNRRCCAICFLVASVIGIIHSDGGHSVISSFLRSEIWTLSPQGSSLDFKSVEATCLLDCGFLWSYYPPASQGIQPNLRFKQKFVFSFHRFFPSFIIC